MSDDLLSRYLGSDKPHADEPSVVRGEEAVPRLEIRDLDGESRSFPYSALEYVHFHPSDGITLTFDEQKIKLRGSNLRPLYEGINSHVVRTVLVLSEEHESEELTVVASRDFDPELPGN